MNSYATCDDDTYTDNDNDTDNNDVLGGLRRQ